MENKLTPNKIKGLKSGRHSDGRGLSLLVTNTGKRWEYQYRFNKKQKTFYIGSFPDVTIALARDKHKKARQWLAEGFDPVEQRGLEKLEQQAEGNDFGHYFYEWIEHQDLATITKENMIQRMQLDIIPPLRGLPIKSITANKLWEVHKTISDRGAKETAKKAASTTNAVFTYLRKRRLLDSNPAIELRSLLPSVPKRQKKHYSHITNPEDLGLLLRALLGSRIRQDYMVTLATKFSLLVFLRPANVRLLTWNNVNFEESCLHFSADEMKTSQPFTVPLSTQALEILREANIQTTDFPYVFMSTTGRRKRTPLSENTIRKALQSCINPETDEPFGKDFITQHGIRHTASTLLNEMGFNPDHIEKSLAHVVGSEIRSTYNKAEYLPQRAQMMQSWADYLDSLRTGADVVPIGINGGKHA